MRDDLMQGIDKEDGDHPQSQQGVFGKEHIGQAILQKYPDQDERRDDLYEKVMPMNGFTTVFAFATQNDIAQDGHI